MLHAAPLWPQQSSSNRPGGLLVIPGASRLLHQPPAVHRPDPIASFIPNILKAQPADLGRQSKRSQFTFSKALFSYTHTHTIFGQKAAVYAQGIWRPMFWFQLHSFSGSDLGKVTARLWASMSPSATQGSPSLFLSPLQGHREDHKEDECCKC